MIKCSKCKKITKKGEPTGLIKKYRTWKDQEGNHKDLVSTKQACMGCVKKCQKD